MARIRTVKPELAKHSDLYDLEMELKAPVRFAWVMLFTVCDREGRFKWRPRDLKVDVLPHDNIDFSRVLDAWLTRGYLVKYRVGHEWYGWLPTFQKHQVINNRESQSVLPPLDAADEKIDNRNNDFDACGTREPREDHADTGEGKGREGKGREGKGREGKGTTTVTVSQISDLYRKYAGVNMVNGGQVVVFQDFIQRFSIETIQEAFAAAALANISVKSFLNWAKVRMERGGNTDADPLAYLDEIEVTA